MLSRIDDMTAGGFVNSGEAPIAVLCVLCGAELVFSMRTLTFSCVFSPYATKLCKARTVVVYSPRFLCVRARASEMAVSAGNMDSWSSEERST